MNKNIYLLLLTWFLIMVLSIAAISCNSSTKERVGNNQLDSLVINDESFLIVYDNNRNAYIKERISGGFWVYIPYKFDSHLLINNRITLPDSILNK